MGKFAEILIGILGWILGKSPVWVVKCLCRLLGWAVWHFSDRRHSILGSLSRAFPEKSEEWHRQIGREHASRMFEMFLLILATPHWSQRKCLDRVKVGASIRALLEGPRRDEPMVFLIPHAAMTEATTMLGGLYSPTPKIVTLYRPLDFKPAERYVKRARGRFGVELVSRREGLLKAKKQLQSGHGVAAILFDQSAGSQGHLMLFFDRVCSTTNLPGLLTVKGKAQPVLVRTRRDGFWRGTIEAQLLPKCGDPAAVMTHAHIALETIVRSDDNHSADWFWAHKRWKGTLRPPTFLGFPERKSYLSEQMKLLGMECLPRNTRVVVRLDPRPEMLGVARKVLHLLTVRRPDAQFWLLVPEDLDSEQVPEGDRTISLPAPRRSRWGVLDSVNREFVDVLVGLDPSAAAVGEARRIQCDLRVGVCHRKPAGKTYHRHVVVSEASYVGDPFAAWIQLFEQLGINKESIEEVLSSGEPVSADPSETPTV